MMLQVGFLFPVIDGQIYLGQRGTDPHKGKYGPIGGKAERYSPNEVPLYKTTISGIQVPIIADRSSIEAGVELGHNAAIREFAEEIFQDELGPEEVSDIARIGSIIDTYQGRQIDCNFYIARIARGAKHFNPSPREITDIRKLADVPRQDIFPIGQAALLGLEFILTSTFGVMDKFRPYFGEGIAEQIPLMTVQAYEAIKDMPHSIVGLTMLKSGLWGDCLLTQKEIEDIKKQCAGATF